MKKAFENINQVLAEWDPIGVGQNLSTDEYQGYIPIILKSVKNKQLLIECLEDILINKIGVEYDATNKEHLADLQTVCDKIIKVYHEASQ